MDSKTGGLSSDEKQRRAAADLARQKVLQTYEKKEVKEAENFIKNQDKAEKRKVLGVSATPVLKQVSTDEWKKYHSAWQDYYQKYYSQYYMNAAKEYVAKEQVKKLREDANLDEKMSELSSALK